MRWAVATKFSEFVIQDLGSIKEVAVVGGSTKDAEVEKLRIQNPSIKFSIFGIENENLDTDFNYLDLNSFEELEDYQKFDLVICSQVLEHVWNHLNFFRNLSELCKPAGKLWLACPASNMVHGSPSYFSAGFSSEYLSLNLECHNFSIMKKGELGSKRYYISTHLNQEWLTEREHIRPITNFDSKNGTALGKINRFRKLLVGRATLTFFRSTVLEGSKFSTESWVFAVKNP
jgi:SAM-dependent methyltransferase